MKLFLAGKDKELMGEMQDFLIKSLEAEGLERMFNGEEVIGIALAKTVIDQAFEKLRLQFEPKVELKKPINDAR